MSKKRTSQLLADLKRLAGESRENILARIKAAKQVLSDLNWVSDTYGGSDIKARDALQDEFFLELNGVFTLGTLIAIYDSFPDESTWKEHRYNLQTMRALWEESRKKEDEDRQPRTRITRAEFDEQATQLQAVRQSLASREKTIQDLQETIERLREENAILRGRIEELQKMHAAA